MPVKLGIPMAGLRDKESPDEVPAAFLHRPETRANPVREMIAAKLASGELPKGVVLLSAQPETRGEAGKALVISAIVAVCAFAIAAQFNHTWAVPIFGLIGVVAVMMAANSFSSTISPSGPALTVRAEDICFDQRVIKWDQIDRVVYRRTKFDHHHGLHTYGSDWSFFSGERRLGGFGVSHVVPGGDYFNHDVLNRIIKCHPHINFDAKE